jgi:hypothetical protein
MGYYIFNSLGPNLASGSGLREHAAGLLQSGRWGVGEGEMHGSALASGDLVLIYVGAPAWEFVGRAELATAVHDWTPSEAQGYPGSSRGGVRLVHVDMWEPPVPMNRVLAQIDRSAGARADFDTGVVRITESEFEAALAVAAAS